MLLILIQVTVTVCKARAHSNSHSQYRLALISAMRVLWAWQHYNPILSTCAAEMCASVSAYQHEAEQFLVRQLTDSGSPNIHKRM